MFLHSCFIRKNTPQLQEKLEKLGIYHNPLDTENYPWLICNFGMYMSIPEMIFTEPGDIKNGDIDCGDNEDLFLAIAAIRDDTDMDQYFICDVDDGDNAIDGACFFCTETEIHEYIGRYMLNWDFIEHLHKASVHELIKYFKQK